MLPLSFLVEVLLTIPLLLSPHVIMQTRSLVEVNFICFFPLPLLEAKATFPFFLVSPVKRIWGFPFEGSPQQ